MSAEPNRSRIAGSAASRATTNSGGAVSDGNGSGKRLRRSMPDCHGAPGPVGLASIGASVARSSACRFHKLASNSSTAAKSNKESWKCSSIESKISPERFLTPFSTLCTWGCEIPSDEPTRVR